MKIAQTILKQLGGQGRLSAMLGAKNFLDHGNALSFKFPNRARSKPNYVKVELAPDDTYTVHFARIGSINFKPLGQLEGVHVGQLRQVIEDRIGLRLRLNGKVTPEYNKNDFGDRISEPGDRGNVLPTSPEKRYESSHWGKKASRKFFAHVPGVPRNTSLVEMGKLLEFHVDPGKGGKAFIIEYDENRDCTLAFSTDESERLYATLPPDYMAWNRKHLLAGDGQWYWLTDVADAAGGRQAEFVSPRRKVQVLGRMTNVVYRTEKVGDGLSDYIHAMAEESGDEFQPFLCVDREGYLHVAGGSYHVPDEGITD